jgi:subtilisin
MMRYWLAKSSLLLMAMMACSSMASGAEGPIYRIPDNEMIPEGVTLSKAADDWASVALDLKSAHAISIGQDVKLAVLDTGGDLSHPLVKDRVIASRDFTGSPNGVSDMVGHGTWCITRAVMTAPGVKIIVGKCLGDQGWGRDEWIEASIDWAVEIGADVVSMSLGSKTPSPRIRGAIQRAMGKGAIVIIVAAAGNEGPSEGTVGFPGGFPETICVASVGRRMNVSRFSSRGPRVDISAPGENVEAGLPGGKYGPMSGTSMATPQIAAIVALGVSHVRSAGRKLTLDDCREALSKTATDIPPTGRDTATGAGFVRPAAFLEVLAATPPPPPSLVKIELREADFAPDAWRRLRQAVPKLDGLTITLKP